VRLVTNKINSGHGVGCDGKRAETIVGKRKCHKNPPKTAKNRVRKTRFWGRQVGAFSVFGVGVYRNPVHFLAKKGLKIKKVSNLGVDVIQPRGSSFFGTGILGCTLAGFVL